MDIALVLLSTSALIGATASLRLKVFVLVPLAVLIVLVSAAVLHMHGFGPGNGVVIIVACLVVNQAAYVLIQIGLGTSASELSFDEVTDGKPAPDREQAVDDDHGDQQSPPPRPLLSQKIARGVSSDVYCTIFA
jgi:hypothetical protein